MELKNEPKHYIIIHYNIMKNTKNKNKNKKIGAKRIDAKRIDAKWTLKYKKSINCNHPKGFSQKQHCKYGRTQKKRKIHN